MNPHRFKSDMEMAWELRPQTDLTPGSMAHHNRFSAPKKKTEEKPSKQKKTEGYKG